MPRTCHSDLGVCCPEDPPSEPSTESGPEAGGAEADRSWLGLSQALGWEGRPSRPGPGRLVGPLGSMRAGSTQNSDHPAGGSWGPGPPHALSDAGGKPWAQPGPLACTSRLGGWAELWALPASEASCPATWKTSLPRDVYQLQLPARAFFAQGLPCLRTEIESALARSQDKHRTAPTC